MRLTTVTQEKHVTISGMFKVLIPRLTSWQGLHMALRCIFVGVYLYMRKRPLGGALCVAAQGWRQRKLWS